MPQKTVVCPTCGLEVPAGEFCKFCGNPLPQASRSHTTEELDNEDNFSSPSVPPDTLPSFDVKIEGIDDEAFAILLARAELAVINEELDRLIEQIGATRQALALEKADKAVLVARAEGLKESLGTTKARRRALLGVKGMIPLERTTRELHLFEDKIGKLDEIIDTLDSVVYEEQRSELVDRVKQLKGQLKSQLKESKKWVKEMESRRKEIKKDASRLDAKYKIGDISDTEYASSRSKLERTISIIERALVGLEDIIETAQEA